MYLKFCKIDFVVVILSAIGNIFVIVQSGHNPQLANRTFGSSHQIIQVYVPDLDRNTEEVIVSRGFLAETYNITTDDGYILKVSRIVDPRDIMDAKKLQRKPMILGHGLFMSADSFLINSPILNTTDLPYGNNLGFSLMLTGRYDVWLVNYRGCEYSQQHVNISVTDYRFWQFTLDHMAQYDLPAVIRFVQNKTSYNGTIGYIGYSQGSTIGFALLASQPHYANIIEPFVALAPVVYLENSRSFYRYLARFVPLLRRRSHKFFLSTAFLNNLIIGSTCHWITPLCSFGLAIRFGFADQRNLNKSRAELYARWYGTSDWNIVQWGQIYLNNRFARFDYGSPELNRQYYGMKMNPDYDIKQISPKVKIIIIQSRNDDLSTIPDIERLRQQLQDVGIKSIDYKIIDDPRFTHLDFMYGMNAGKEYINALIDMLARYT